MWPFDGMGGGGSGNGRRSRRQVGGFGGPGFGGPMGDFNVSMHAFTSRMEGTSRRMEGMSRRMSGFGPAMEGFGPGMGSFGPSREDYEHDDLGDHRGIYREAYARDAGGGYAEDEDNEAAARMMGSRGYFERRTASASNQFDRPSPAGSDGPSARGKDGPKYPGGYLKVLGSRGVGGGDSVMEVQDSPAEDMVRPRGSGVDAFFGSSWRTGPSVRLHVLAREGGELEKLVPLGQKGTPYEALSVPSSITVDKLMNFLYEGDTPELMCWFKVKRISSQTSMMERGGDISYSDSSTRQTTLDQLGWSFKDCLEPVWITMVS